MTAHPVYDTVKGAAVGSNCQEGPPLRPPTSVKAYYSATGAANAGRETPITFATPHARTSASPWANPHPYTSIVTLVPVRPIGRTGTEVTTIQNTRESEPRSQSQKTAVPENRSQAVRGVMIALRFALVLPGK